MFLKHLPEGILLITGPMKVNGVPLRRVNARYVIATKAKVGLKELDHKLMEKVSANDYWKREKSTKSKKDEEVFFKQGEKSEVRVIGLDALILC